MTMEEREKVTEVWSIACKKNRQTVMIQVGGTNLPDVQRLVRIFHSLPLERPFKPVCVVYISGSPC